MVPSNRKSAKQLLRVVEREREGYGAASLLILWLGRQNNATREMPTRLLPTTMTSCLCIHHNHSVSICIWPWHTMQPIEADESPTRVYPSRATVCEDSKEYSKADVCMCSQVHVYIMYAIYLDALIDSAPAL